MTGMKWLGALLLFPVAIAAAYAQPTNSTEWRTKSSASPIKDRTPTDAARELANYARCAIGRRYTRARAMVLATYASEEQSRLMDGVTSSIDDSCLYGTDEETRMQVGPQVLAGAFAQALVLKEYPDLPAVVGRFQLDQKDEALRLSGMNASEAFGRCVVQRDPTASLALFASLAASPAERQAVNALRDDLSACLAAGSTIQLNAMFVRNAGAVAAYRLAQQIEPRGASGGAR